MINHCIYLLDGKGLQRDFTGQYRKLPAAWIIAHKTMITLEPKLALRITDCSYILRSELSLYHVLNVAKAHGKVTPDARSIKTLSSRGVTRLADISRWHMANGVVSHFKSKNDAPRGVIWTSRAKENWIGIAQILNDLNAKWFTIGEVDLMTSREIRKSRVENYIKTMARIQPFPSSKLNHGGFNWASDGSMIPAASGIGDPKSVATALTGPSTLVLRIPGRNICILYGELMGIIAGLLMASHGTRSNTLHTDHLNSVRFIQDLRTKMGSETTLRSTNARSYYHWIADLATHNHTVVVHVKSHTNEEGIGSQLNAEADHYASRAQNAKHVIPIAPTSTFTMDNYTFH
jgi:hypothetical protein